MGEQRQREWKSLHHGNVSPQALIPHSHNSDGILSVTVSFILALPFPFLAIGLSFPSLHRLSLLSFGILSTLQWLPDRNEGRDELNPPIFSELQHHFLPVGSDPVLHRVVVFALQTD